MSGSLPDQGDGALIDAFCDALWLEHGLSKNTLAAYRRDLSIYADWLLKRGTPLLHASETDVQAYMRARHANSQPSTANRRMSVLRRFYRLALRNRQIDTDPTPAFGQTEPTLPEIPVLRGSGEAVARA